MIKKVTTLIIVFVFFLFTAELNSAYGQAPPPPSSKKGNFTKGKFSKKNAWSNNGKALAPPNPNADPWGNTIPISNGLAFLIIGSALYLIKRVKDEKKETKALKRS